MKTLQIFFVALVAFEHIYFMILELFYWDKPKGLKAFGQTLEAAKSSKTLAKNQGLYNGFLVAGLIWAIVNKNNFEALAIFFLMVSLVLWPRYKAISLLSFGMSLGVKQIAIFFFYKQKSVLRFINAVD